MGNFDLSLRFWSGNHSLVMVCLSAVKILPTGIIIWPKKSFEKRSSSQRSNWSSSSDPTTLKKNSSFQTGLKFLYMTAVLVFVLPNCNRTKGSLRPFGSRAAKSRPSITCTCSFISSTDQYKNRMMENSKGANLLSNHHQKDLFTSVHKSWTTPQLLRKIEETNYRTKKIEIETPIWKTIHLVPTH